MSCARNVVVVGDQRQLPPIPIDAANGLAPPAPPTTASTTCCPRCPSCTARPSANAVCEHYRCDPAIIGFCNKKFYDGELIPFTRTRRRERPMVVVRTVEGNHMRQHRGGGRSNQREIDVIPRRLSRRTARTSRKPTSGSPRPTGTRPTRPPTCSTGPRPIPSTAFRAGRSR